MLEGEQNDPLPIRYDVFLSFAGPDRELARQLMHELRRLGLRVFVDDMIAEFEGIDDGITRALAGAKTFVAIYSREFATRPACQRELTAAFIASRRGSSPTERILVINPEPTAEHVQPIELADTKHAEPPRDSAAARGLADKIRVRAESIETPLGDAVRPTTPPWFGAVAGSHRFVGRHRELWALHSALHRSEYPLAHTASCGPVVSLCGLPGAGKTALVAAYAWAFGGAYPGGVFWNRPGDGLPEGSESYRESLRSASVAAGLRPLAGASRDDLVGGLGNALRRRGLPVLWIIDDAPEGFGPADLTGVIPPAGDLVHTVVVSRENAFEGALPVHELEMLSKHDATALLGMFPSVTDGLNCGAADQLLERLGGHCGALCAAGRQLRDAHGLISMADYVTAIENGEVRPGTVVAPALARLTDDETIILRLAALSGSDTVSAELIATALGNRWRAATALAGIRRKLLATRHEDSWSFHPLATAELARMGTPSDSAMAAHLIAQLRRPTLARAASRATLDVLRSIVERLLGTRSDLSLSDEYELLRLVTRPELSVQTSHLS